MRRWSQQLPRAERPSFRQRRLRPQPGRSESRLAPCELRGPRPQWAGLQAAAPVRFKGVPAP
eukprot:3344726-Alexandrium_andersonii.AAC.1